MNDALAHEGVISRHVLDERRGDVLPRDVRVAAKHDGAFGAVDEVLDALRVCRGHDAAE